MTKSITVDLSPDGESLTAYVPSMTVEGGHHISIPLDLRGLVILYDILKARSDKSQTEKRIGSKASPTSHIIKEWLKANPVTKPDIASKKSVAAKRDASVLDINDLDIQL